MHYKKSAFGKGKLTLETKNPYYADLIGTGSGLSKVDIIQLNLLYKCPPYKGEYPVEPTPDCHDYDSDCGMNYLDGKCKFPYVRDKCRLSCKQCIPGDGSTKPPPSTTRQTSTKEIQRTTEAIHPTTNPPLGCKDTSSNCASVASYCKVGSWIDFMKRNCRRTCGYC